VINGIVHITIAIAHITVYNFLRQIQIPMFHIASTSHIRENTRTPTSFSLCCQNVVQELVVQINADWRGMANSRWGRENAWGRILVQDIPTPGIFNSLHLTWVTDVAYIKTKRLNHFVEGEISAVRRSPPDLL
jgi:hypothetical protein